jgi:hypothetical protein
MLLLVALVRTDVSEEFSNSFIRVTTIGELGKMLAVLTRATRHNIPEDAILYSHYRENLNSYKKYIFSNFFQNESCKFSKFY